MINKTKILFILLGGIFASSCTAIKTASSEVNRDPVYQTKEEVKAAIVKSNVAIERRALDRGEASNQGKRSGSRSSKYDYMPATSYAERFNRTGNSFFLNDRGTGNFGNNGFNSWNNQPRLWMSYGGMFNPYMNMNMGCNPWSNPWNDPWFNFQMMQSGAYPFFTYNPYMFSYGLLNNGFDPWMMNSSFANPYFYNPYYFHNPWGYGNNNFRNTFRTASRPTRNTFTSARRTSTVGTSTSSNNTTRTNSYGSSTNSNTNSNKSQNSNNTYNSGSTFSTGGSGTTRGGYNPGSRAPRGSGGTSGSKRR